MKPWYSIKCDMKPWTAEKVLYGVIWICDRSKTCYMKPRYSEKCYVRPWAAEKSVIWCYMDPSSVENVSYEAPVYQKGVI